MGVPKDVADHIERVLRPLRNRIANIVARGVVTGVNDSKKQQLLQFGALAEETIDDAEHFHPYGFSSVPLEGAELAAIFINGDRAHPLVIAASDRNHRPTGKSPGEVTMYNNAGASMTMTKDGDIIARAAPGREFQIDDGSGTAGALVTLAQFMNHTHATAATGTPSVPIAFAPDPAPALTGTTVLKAK